MERRTIIPTSTIKRLAAASHQREREEYNARLLSSQENTKEKPPTYSLTHFDFDINTRATKIEILQTQSYRTIEKYITKNYVKYPVYSQWKVKQKKITKTIKLTNMVLESLNKHEDELIRRFAETIILKLNNEELFPSWFIKLYLQKELDENLNVISSKLQSLKRSQNTIISTQKRKIDNLNIEINNYTKLLEKTTIKKEKLLLSLKNIRQAKPNFLKAIFSLGLYCYLISQRRLEKLEAKLLQTNNYTNGINLKLDALQVEIKDCQDIIDNCTNTITASIQEYNINKAAYLENYNLKLSQIQPLSTAIEKDDKFIMLKYFSGLEYKLIIGVYIIHNIENDKYYVGQSKDVMRRIKQHFKGTVPQNPIFAEDYYTSTFEKKEELFEIKIIPCQTKDELDRLEKDLIFKYDSWNNGYNGTSGNK